MPLDLNATLARLLDEAAQAQVRVDNLKSRHRYAEKAMENVRNAMVELRIKLAAAEEALAEAQTKYTNACVEARKT